MSSKKGKKAKPVAKDAAPDPAAKGKERADYDFLSVIAPDPSSNGADASADNQDDVAREDGGDDDITLLKNDIGAMKGDIAGVRDQVAELIKLLKPREVEGLPQRRSQEFSAQPEDEDAVSNSSRQGGGRGAGGGEGSEAASLAANKPELEVKLSTMVSSLAASLPAITEVRVKKPTEVWSDAERLVDLSGSFNAPAFAPYRLRVFLMWLASTKAGHAAAVRNWFQNFAKEPPYNGRFIENIKDDTHLHVMRDAFFRAMVPHARDISEIYAYLGAGKSRAKDAASFMKEANEFHEVTEELKRRLVPNDEATWKRMVNQMYGCFIMRHETKATTLLALMPSHNPEVGVDLSSPEVIRTLSMAWQAGSSAASSAASTEQGSGTRSNARHKPAAAGSTDQKPQAQQQQDNRWSQTTCHRCGQKGHGWLKCKNPPLPGWEPPMNKGQGNAQGGSKPAAPTAQKPAAPKQAQQGN